MPSLPIDTSGTYKIKTIHKQTLSGFTDILNNVTTSSPSSWVRPLFAISSTAMYPGNSFQKIYRLRASYTHTSTIHRIDIYGYGVFEDEEILFFYYQASAQGITIPTNWRLNIGNPSSGGMYFKESDYLFYIVSADEEDEI